MSKPEKPANSEASALFSLQRVYPDATKAFTVPSASIQGAKSSALVFLDTNALLVPFGVGTSSLTEVGKVFEKLTKDKRLFVPAQVAREFAKVRPQKITEIYSQLSQRRPAQRQITKYPLLESFKEYQDAIAIERRLEATSLELRNALDKVLDLIGLWHWNDPVSKLYESFFREGNIIEAKTPDAELKESILFRSELRVPPGFKDKNKDDNAGGDVIIWQTILDHTKNSKLSTVLVSGDEKSDWWHRSNDGPLYPRYELQYEYFVNSGGGSFFIMTFSHFLDLFGAAREAVIEAQAEETAIRLQPYSERRTPYSRLEGKIIRLTDVIQKDMNVHWGSGHWTRLIFSDEPYRILSKIECEFNDAQMLRHELANRHWPAIAHSADPTIRKRDVGGLRFTYSIGEPGWWGRSGGGFPTQQVLISDIEVIAKSSEDKI